MNKAYWIVAPLIAGLIGCADVEAPQSHRVQAGTSIDVPGTAIEDRSTLAYAVGQLRVYINSRYECSAVAIVNARRLTVVGNRVEFAEEWETNMCGMTKRFVMSFLHDMTGGIVLTIRE
jgi:hypothetical protein